MPTENSNTLKTKWNNTSDCVLCGKYAAMSMRINVMLDKNKNTEQYIQLYIKSNSNLNQKFWPFFFSSIFLDTTIESAVGWMRNGTYETRAMCKANEQHQRKERATPYE